MIEPIQILAVSDYAVFAMWGVNTFLTLALGVGLFALKSGQEGRREELGKLGRDLHEANTKLLDERDRRVSHSMANHATVVTGAMDAWRARLERSEIALEKLTGVRADAELSLTRALTDVKDFVRECAPSRDEFTDVKAAIKDLTESVNKVERENISRDDMRKLLAEVLRK